MTPSSPHSADLFPLARYFEERAAQEEIQALVQFSFYHPYLAELLTACMEANLDLIVLKGAALAETVYPRPSLRFFGDMDVLVRAPDVSRARTILESLGYVPDTGQCEEHIQGRDCQTNFFQHLERGPVVVELHTQLINNPLFFGTIHLDEQGVWGRAEAACLAGVKTRVLGLEDQLLHLCLHLACHYGAAPRSLWDIDWVCRARTIDWPLFLTIARRARGTAACFAGLSAVRGLLGTAIPDTVLDDLAPRFGRGLLERLATARAADIAQSRTEALRAPLLWLLMDTPAARLHALRRILFPSFRWLTLHSSVEIDPGQGPAVFSRQTHFALLRVHWGSLLRRVTRILFHG